MPSVDAPQQQAPMEAVALDSVVTQQPVRMSYTTDSCDLG